MKRNGFRSPYQLPLWLQEGLPGWVLPALTTLTVVGIWWAAAFFNLKSAAEFWEKNGGSVTAWMATTMGLWLAFKGHGKYLEAQMSRPPTAPTSPTVVSVPGGNVTVEGSK